MYLRRNNIPRLIVDMQEPLAQYRSTAPSLLKNYIDFKEFVSLIVNIESAPYYDDEVIESLIALLQSKICHLEDTGLLTDESLSSAEIYIQTFVAYIDCFIANIIKCNCNETDYIQYSINDWLDFKTPIVTVRPSL